MAGDGATSRIQKVREVEVCEAGIVRYDAEGAVDALSYFSYGAEPDRGELVGVRRHARSKPALPGGRIKRISHVGSTAIRGIWAKPIVDILVEARALTDLPVLGELLQKSGYTLMSAWTERPLLLTRRLHARRVCRWVFHSVSARAGRQ